MNDMSAVIVPKSDQINADDLIGRDMTITIRDVHIKGGQEQPVSIYFDGSEKAFRPCKSMSRVLVAAWGADAKNYVGRSLTLYRDPKVKWGGLEVGGIRISHMSHIDKPMTMALAESRAVRKPVTVKPLVAEVKQHPASADVEAKWAASYSAKVGQAPDAAALDKFIASKAALLDEMREKRPELHDECLAAVTRKRTQIEADAWETDDAPADASAD